MANFRRKKPAIRTFGRHHDKWKSKRLEERGVCYYWLGSWPAYHDIVHHRRPNRRVERLLQKQIVADSIDPEAANWPLARRPHHYYW